MKTDVIENLDDLTDAELAAYLKKLDPKSRAIIGERVNKRLTEETRVWFCGDRRCDGAPHGVYNYKHARGSKKPDGSGSQYPPRGTHWLVWLMSGGRGSGKTKTGSEYSRFVSKKIPDLALIGPTGPAVRNVMIEGSQSGLIKACEDAGESYLYEPSKGRFTFQSGARAQLFSAEEPDRIRGANFGFVWGDEPAHWDDPKAMWDLTMLALRTGRRPHALATTTPLPSPFVKELIADPETVVVRGSTYDNMANLAENVVRRILKRYEGTFLGRQEIYGEVIDDREGALWSSLQFDEKDFYFDYEDVRESFNRVLVGIDPAGSNNKRSDETGIVVGGNRGEVIYALDDFSGKYTPAGWAAKAIYAHDLYNADAIVVEKNYGGAMCRHTLETAGFTGRIVEANATEGKRVRAEPIAARYEQHMARHRRGGKMQKLESEQVSYIPGEGKSPNRLDAWVWVATKLTKGSGKTDIGDPTEGTSGPPPAPDRPGPGVSSASPASRLAQVMRKGVTGWARR